MDDEFIVSGTNTGIKLKDICEVSFKPFKFYLKE